MLKWRRIKSDATWSRRIDVDTTSFWCCVPTGMVCSTAWENVPSDKCAQRRYISFRLLGLIRVSVVRMKKLASLAIQSEIRRVKILIRLHECTGWSESSLDRHFRRYVFWRCGSLSGRINWDATPTSDFQPIRSLDSGFWYNLTYLMTNSADPDQLASFRSQLIWIYTVCEGSVYPGSAGLGLT